MDQLQIIRDPRIPVELLPFIPVVGTVVSFHPPVLRETIRAWNRFFCLNVLKQSYAFDLTLNWQK